MSSSGSSTTDDSSSTTTTSSSSSSSATEIRSIVETETSSSSSSSTDAQKEGWTDVVSKKRKKKQKGQKKPKPHNIEEFYGDAKPSFELKIDTLVRQRKTGVKIRDVQNLVMWILADGMNSEWIFIKNKPLVKKVVLVMLTSLGEDLFTEKASILPTLRSFLPHAAFPTGAPGSKTRLYSPMSELLNRPVKKTKTAKKAKTEPTDGTPHIEFDTSKALVPPSSYTLTATQLSENKYPLNPQLEGYVTTTEHETTATELIGVDCEMCTTAFGLELTRVTLVNQKLEVMYDKLVKPTNPILNYNTRFSGIDEGTLRNVTTTLKEVQDDILKIISSNTILVGHSLENDLCALKMVHKRVIDTAILYPHPQGLPYKQALKVLSQLFLKQAIQMDQGGHDSIEDARAALKLTLLKISKGPSFGDSQENETTESILKVLHNYNRKCTLLDRVSLVRSYTHAAVNSIPCLNDEEVQERLVKSLQSDAQFIWAQFHNLSSHFSDQFNGTKLCPTKTNGEAMTLDEVVQQLDSRVQQLVQSSPPRTLLIFTTGSGNGSQVKSMNDRRGNANWIPEDEAKLEEIVLSARKGMSFLYMT